VKKILILIPFLILFLLCGCNSTSHESPVSYISGTPIIPNNTLNTPKISDNNENQNVSAKYQTIDVGSLIDILNTYYKDELVQLFGNHMIIDYPFVKIDSRYEYDSIDTDGNMQAVTKFIQGRITKKDTIINISIIEDKTFDNGGYIFSNTNNLHYDYFNNEEYTISIYKYNKSYIVFEFFNTNLESKERKDFITEFAKLLEDNYIEREKLIYNEDDEDYTVETFSINSLTDGLNAFYKDRITSYFEKYVMSEIPLYEIKERYTLDEISEEDNSILAVTKYLQGIINEDNVRISIIEDKTLENKGYIFTTDEVNSNPMISLYRYNNMYIVFELYNAEISKDFMTDAADTIRDFADIMIDILR
jgi:hypothetical protein